MENFPCGRQILPVDCGPACLRNIAAYYDKSYSLEYINRACGLSSRGVSFANLIQGAETLGFQAIPVQCTLSQLIHEVPLPAIIHWKQNHFVVVYQVTKPTFLGEDDILHVSDPARGLLIYRAETFRKYWMGQHTKPGMGAVLLIKPNF